MHASPLVGEHNPSALYLSIRHTRPRGVPLLQGLLVQRRVG